MADEQSRRSYRSNTPEPTPTPAPIPQSPAVSEPTPPSRGSGKWHNVTGLFKSASGKSYTIRVTDEIAAKLKEVQPGDSLSISAEPVVTEGKKDRISFSYVEGD